jgi:hypothetical protein
MNSLLVEIWHVHVLRVFGLCLLQRYFSWSRIGPMIWCHGPWSCQRTFEIQKSGVGISRRSYHVLSQSPAILHANSWTETLILTYWLNLFEVYSAHISTWWLGGKFRHGIQVCQEPPPLPPPLQPPPPEDFRYLPVISGQTLDIFGWQLDDIWLWINTYTYHF